MKIDMTPDSEESLKVKVLKALPGSNCGVCGYPGGCQGYAQELLERAAPSNQCSLGGEPLLRRLKELIEPSETERRLRVSVLLCRGGKKNCQDSFFYQGWSDCRAASLLFGGNKGCLSGCLGLGTCVKVCPNSALWMGKDGLPQLKEALCKGCGKCVQICPQKVRKLLPKTQKVYVACREKRDIKMCSVGCNLCGECLKFCPYEALSLSTGYPVIDESKCRSCGICVHKCPQGVFIDRVRVRPTAFIGTNCDGCGFCKPLCPLGAIEGEEKKQHKVERKKCIGCGLCFEGCPKKAVSMFGALGYVEEGGVRF